MQVTTFTVGESAMHALMVPGRPQFGAFMRLKMTELGWSKDKTAREANVEASLITYYLKAENAHAIPKLDTLRAFCRAFGVDLKMMMRVCGAEIDSNGESADSTAALFDLMPELRAIADDVVALPADGQVAAAMYIAELRRRYNQP